MGFEDLNEYLDEVELTDHQLTLLEALPVFSGDTHISFGNQSGIFSKRVFPRFVAVNFSKMYANGVIFGCLTFRYSPSKKTCSFVHGNVDELDQFLDDTSSIVN